jgi:hypothetical protein
MYRYGDGNEQEVCTKCHKHLRHPIHVTTKEQDDAALAELHALEDAQFLSIVDALVKGQECSQPKTN